MKIYRYSHNGFACQHQAYHHERIMNELSDKVFYENVLPKVPDHLRRICEENHEKAKRFYGENGEGRIKDIERGLWAFGSPEFDRMSLNHLSTVPPRWVADIPGDATVYDVNLKGIYLASDLRSCPFGFYIPEREAHRITNIRRFPDDEHEGRSLRELRELEREHYDEI